MSVQKLVEGVRMDDIGFVVAGLIDPFHAEIRSWNSNVGYVGWFYILPYQAPLYLIYTGALAILSVILAKIISRTPSCLDMVWYAWLIFLLPGWLAAFVVFVFSLMLFLLLQYLSSLVVRVTSKRAVDRRRSMT
jgi:hypothetical protein